VKLAALFEEIRRKHRYATADDIRQAFGDYHNVLHWLITFLAGQERGTDSQIIDACALAETQTPDFHDWLVHWAARATVRHALQSQSEQIRELASQYETEPALHPDHPPISIDQFRVLITNSDQIRAQLDVLCRFVLLIRGIAKEPIEEVAAQLGISGNAVESAYCVAFDLLRAADRVD